MENVSYEEYKKAFYKLMRNTSKEEMLRALNNYNFIVNLESKIYGYDIFKLSMTDEECIRFDNKNTEYCKRLCSEIENS